MQVEYAERVIDPDDSACVAPYSTQLLMNAPIALPAFWYELEELEPPALTPAEVVERLRTLTADPWQTMASIEQRITPVHERSLVQAVSALAAGSAHP